MASLNVVYQCEYKMRPAIEKLNLRYNYCRMLTTYGDMYGASYKDDKISIHKETMTGYEEYLARSMALWGHDTDEARRYKFLKEVPIYGVNIPTDTRTFYSNFVGSESYWNTAFDYSPDDNESAKYINNIYKVQEARYHHTGQFTAVTEDNIDRKPYFLYNTIYTNGEPWKVINHGAQDYNDLKAISTKAGLAMKPLFGTPYADKIFDYLKTNYDPQNGYYAGIYEKTAGNNKALTLNTNSMVLLSLLYSNIGAVQMLNPVSNRGTYDYYRNTVNNFKCLPTENTLTILEPSSPTDNMIQSIDTNHSTIAWTYFTNNYNEETGFVNGSNKYKILSSQDIGRTLMANVSAKGLGIISDEVFQNRSDKILDTLLTLPLFNEELPNRHYHSKTAKMVTASGEDSHTGGGWNLYHIAHLLTGLYHLQNTYPKYQDKVFAIVSRFDFSRAIEGQKMYHNEYYPSDEAEDKEYIKSIKDPAKEYYIHNALRLFNIKSYSHFVDEKNLNYVAVYKHEIPMGYKYRVTNGETYLWSMLEHPYYLKYKHYASNIYLVLKDRYEITNKLATSSYESIDIKPHTIYNDIYNDKRHWSDFDKKQRSVPKHNILSTKASFVYDALYGYEDNHSKRLMQKVAELYNTEKGWYGGFYTTSYKKNRSVNINTNSAILEALYYKRIGNLYYQNKVLLQDKVNLHAIKLKDKYSLESPEDAFFYKISDQFINFESNDTQVIRVERKGENFVMRYGIFSTLAEIKTFHSEHSYRLRNFTIVKTDVDSSNFLYANRYYSYNYKLPYENKIIDEENIAFKVYYQAYQEEAKKQNKPNAKERAKLKEEAKEEAKKKAKEEKKQKKKEAKEEKNKKEKEEKKKSN
ncbi:MAG: DUF3131 domain-containing protein [Sulfurovum sp.]|nr:DUF3131 domain-containing protein [Sulfurovum sp.]